MNILKTKADLIDFIENDDKAIFLGKYPEKILSMYEAKENGLPVFFTPILFLNTAKKEDIVKVLKSVEFDEGRLRILADRQWQSGIIPKSQSIFFNEENWIEKAYKTISEFFDKYGYVAILSVPMPTKFDYSFNLFVNPDKLVIEYMPAGFSGAELNKNLVTPCGIINFKTHEWGKYRLQSHSFHEISKETKDFYYSFIPTCFPCIRGFDKSGVKKWLLDNNHNRINEKKGPISKAKIQYLISIAKDIINKDFYSRMNAPSITLFGQIYKGKVYFYGWMTADDNNLIPYFNKLSKNII
ncbi:MAG: hypothetical protein OIF36_00635 [Alphaproteobacteria bacterium]|nr:hypothetical protein [Alphaproteobacteria bacterium]